MRVPSLLLALAVVLHAPPAAASTLDALAPSQALHGFTAVARYRDGANHVLGGRFVHKRTGFTLDLLTIPSVPQGFIWVNSLPTSDKGEPHTQEHLLLGKGRIGGEVANMDAMSLVESTAYTQQWRTAYQFDTKAGPEVFYELFDKRMDALLHPNYTDEEVRREVRNFGVKSVDGKLALEEKGTVYNEMTSTFERPWNRVYHTMDRAIYGDTHPMSYVAGGSPEALRTLTPQDIRKFHDANYRLGNMGMVASLPPSMPADAALMRFDRILNGLEPHPLGAAGEPKFPKPQGAPAGQIQVVGFPDRNAANPGQVSIGWPAEVTFADDRERLLGDLFGSALGGDATTNLYKRFIDSRTRKRDLGTTAVWAGFDDELGHPFRVGFEDVGAAHLTPAELETLRAEVQDEIAKVAAYPDGSPELAAFEARVLALVQETRRAYAKFVNSPPGFGFRHTPSTWIDHLNHLAKRPGFDKPVTLDADLAAIERLVKGKQNPWRERVKAWKLLAAKPYVVAAKPEPALVEQDAKARQQRVAEETQRLAKGGDVQAALKAYQSDYDQASAKLEASSPKRRFLANPPMERDPGLDVRTAKLAKGVPLVASSFASMTGVMTQLAARVDDVPDNRLVYLALLPQLLTEVGVIDHGKPISHEEVARRLRTEVLGVSAGFTSNNRSHRCELSLTGQGLTAAESQRAVAWMRLMATSPDWRVENLPRLRDVVDQAATALHGTMRGSEESWVNDPAAALYTQHDARLLTANSFLTREFFAHRLRWLLRDAGPNPAPLFAFFDQLESIQGDRTRLLKVATALADGAPTGPLQAPFAKLTPDQRKLAVEAGKDLASYVPDLPDGSLAHDWYMLCREMSEDLAEPPARVLLRLDQTRQDVLNVRRTRVVMVGPRGQQQVLIGAHVNPLLSALPDHAVGPKAPDHGALIARRVKEHEVGPMPRFFGLLNGNTQGGVVVNGAPGTSYADHDREALLRYLASKLYAGHGAHGLFMKTWAAGLAYSNGIRGSAEAGRVGYYAERCPDLAQTLGFVTEQLYRAKPDPALVEYALALAFDDSNADRSFEERGSLAATEALDGYGPEVVRRFRQGLLRLRREPHLAEELFKRMPSVYGSVLPGYAKLGLPADGTYLVIGPETQLQSYERYLSGHVGQDAKLYRLYPRDFWLY